MQKYSTHKLWPQATVNLQLQQDSGQVENLLNMYTEQQFYTLTSIKNYN